MPFPDHHDLNGHIEPKRGLHPETLALHADDPVNFVSDVAPPIHVSSTFRYSRDSSTLVPARDQAPLSTTSPYIYSREDAPTLRRLETVLESLLHASSVCYSSGLAALHALYVFLNPKKIAIGGGYHGSHGVLDLHVKLTGATVLPLERAEELGPGDVLHLETPLNPYGTALNIRTYKEIARRKGALLLVDSTFGPPGLTDPFLNDGREDQGADIVMHSGTKYLGGHSDLLWGVLATKRPGWADKLRFERLHLGSVMGGLEGWLGVRSLRTLEVRVRRQSANAESLVAWLASQIGADGSEGAVKEVVEDVRHASVQADAKGWIKKQMPGGYGPVFAILMKTVSVARRLPGTLELFSHATSLGGVETLIEWRAMSDATTEPRLCRISVGLEHWEDLRDDLLQGCKALHEAEKQRKRKST